MASRAMKPCLHPGCRVLVRDTARCDAHSVDVVRRSEAKWYDAAWRRASLAVLMERPVCQRCARASSTLVHHVQEIRDAPERRLDPTNLLALCASCHRTIHAESP